MATISATAVGKDPVVIDDGSTFVTVENPDTSSGGVRVAIHGGTHVLAPGIKATYESGGFPVTVESVGRDEVTIRHDGNRSGIPDPMPRFPVVDAIRLTNPTESWATGAAMYGPRNPITPQAFDRMEEHKRMRAAERAAVLADVLAGNERDEADRTALMSGGVTAVIRS
jgi:hypothetical protein